MRASGLGAVFSPDGWRPRGGLVNKGRGPREDRASRAGTKQTAEDPGLARRPERRGEGENKMSAGPGSTPVAVSGRPP